MKIGIDLMGGDQPPQAIFEAVLQVSGELKSSCSLVPIATHGIYPKLESQLLSFREITPPIEFVLTDEAIEMHESPLLAFRRKKNSSMAVGLKLLKAKKIDAFISTGNTGALVASSIHYLPCLDGVERPAFLVTLPTETVVLDVGANLLPKPEHLVAYGILGSLYQTVVHGVKTPKIALLNIGAEEQKGTKELKETYQLLQKKFKDRFIGNIEPREAFQKKADVLVTDGFSGNIFLKTAEGMSRHLIDYVEKSEKNSEKLVSRLNQRFNYAEHPGALLCGLDGLVVKCHGYSDAMALMNGIRGAITLAEKKTLEKMKKKLT